MKKTINIILIFALLSALGLTAGCKKPTESKTVDVTFKAVGNAKTYISTRGVVEFIPGDRIHVYDANYGYLGYLDYQAPANASHADPATFYGALKQWNDNTTLRFYYMGDHQPVFGQETRVSLADQFYEGVQSPENDLENIAAHFHVSLYEEANVAEDKLEFTGALTSQMSIAVFNTSAFNDGTNVKMYIAHVAGQNENADPYPKNCIVISSNGELSYAVAGAKGAASTLTGHFTTGPGQVSRYVALCPCATPSLYVTFTSNQNVAMEELKMYAIEVNTLYTDWKNVGIAAEPVSTDQYVDLAVASDHVFTVADGKTVKFAKGNLVYDQGRFKMHKKQYSSVHNVNTYHMIALTNVKGTNDLFTWASSGWDCGSERFMPYAGQDGVLGHEYGPVTNNLTGAYAKADWGVYQFGMNATSTNWRTLGAGEWQYVFKTRPNAASRYGHGKVNGMPGMILLPDDWTKPDGVEFAPGNSSGWGQYNGNEYSGEQWTLMEAAGAVFLPVTCRSENGHYQGLYWSSTNNTKTYTYGQYVNEHVYAYPIEFSDGSDQYVFPYLNCYFKDRTRADAYSVRLVSDVN